MDTFDGGNSRERPKREIITYSKCVQTSTKSDRTSGLLYTMHGFLFTGFTPSFQ